MQRSVDARVRRQGQEVGQFVAAAQLGQQLDDGTAIDLALLDTTLAQLPARLGDTSALRGGGRIEEAITLLAELSRSNELTDFLTLPAYARID